MRALTWYIASLPMQVHLNSSLCQACPLPWVITNTNTNANTNTNTNTNKKTTCELCCVGQWPAMRSSPAGTSWWSQIMKQFRCGFLQFKIRGFTDGARWVLVFLRSWLEVLGTWVLKYLRSAAESWSRMMSLTPSSPALFVHIKICFNIKGILRKEECGIRRHTPGTRWSDTVLFTF